MPRPPGILDRVNYVVRFIENPCNAPWAVYFELALPPLGNAIITLLSFGMDDVIRGFFRPKGLRSGRHSRKGRRGGKGGKGIPEVGNAIGKRLPGAERAAGRSVTQGVKNMWLIDGALQRILWYWLVADVVSTFFFEWATLINETAFCRSQPQQRRLNTGVNEQHAALGGWNAIQAQTTEYNEGFIDFAQGAIQIPAGKYFVSVAVNATNNGGSQHTNQIAIFSGLAPVNAIAFSTAVTVDVGGSAGMIATADLTGPATFNVRERISSGFALNNDEMVFIMEARQQTP